MPCLSGWAIPRPIILVMDSGESVSTVQQALKASHACGLLTAGV